MGTQPTKINPKSHKFTKLKNWAHQIYQRIQPKTRFTNTLRALLITRRPIRIAAYYNNQLIYHQSNKSSIKQIIKIIMKTIKKLVIKLKSKIHKHIEKRLNI